MIPLGSIVNLRFLKFRQLFGDNKKQIIWLLQSLSDLRGAYHGVIAVDFRFRDLAAISIARDELHTVDEVLTNLKRNSGADVQITLPFKVEDLTEIESLFPQATKMQLMYVLFFFLMLFTQM
jgi:hypothetical protein